MKKDKGENVFKNKKVITIIVILVLIIIGLVGYIAFDKKVIFKNIASVEEKKGGVVKKLDLSKSLNTTGVKYSNPSTKEGDFGISMSINDDKKYVTMSINWPKFGPLSGSSAYSDNTENYQINGFSKKIKSTFIGSLGQDSVGITLFFIMEDGTVEYMPMFINKGDHYEMNYQYNSEGKVDSFKVSGILSGVEDVYKLYNVDASKGIGRWGTTIGVRKDGSFYDLGAIIDNTTDDSKKEESIQNTNQGPIGLDSDKCINNKDFSYTSFYDLSGVTAHLLSDKKSVSFSGRWDLFDASQPTGNTFEYKINNFQGEVAEVLIGSFGQDVYHSAIIYLMADGTIEYTPIRKARETNDFRSYGKVNGIDGIVRIKTVFIEPKNSSFGGGVSVIAQKADGTFYNLSEFIEA